VFNISHRGYEVSIGKFYQKEIDFAAIKGDAKAYIHLTTTLKGEKTKQYEIVPLLAIKKRLSENNHRPNKAAGL
jgi:hypothetical protein